MATSPAASAPKHSAESYLAAVVAGDEQPDPHRIAAAKALIRFEKPEAHPALPPRARREIAALQAENRERAEWEKTASAIRARFARRNCA